MTSISLLDKEPRMLPLIPIEENSVFDKIGGHSAVNLVVEDFYDRAFNDVTLLPFFEHVDMELLRKKMKIFLKMTLGGKVEYTGKNLRQAHAHMVLTGLSDLHFDKVVSHLNQSLKENGVNVDMRQTISEVVEDYRDAVLNR